MLLKKVVIYVDLDDTLYLHFDDRNMSCIKLDKCILDTFLYTDSTMSCNLGNFQTLSE